MSFYLASDILLQLRLLLVHIHVVDQVIVSLRAHGH